MQSSLRRTICNIRSPACLVSSRCRDEDFFSTAARNNLITFRLQLGGL